MADESRYPTRIAPYGLRMPDELKARLQAAADANNRSMNAEIVARLEQSLAGTGDISPQEFEAMISKFVRTLVSVAPDATVKDLAEVVVKSSTDT